MIIFITGTSRGLGLHLKQWLLARGHTVIGCSRAPASGSNDLAVDVTDPTACRRAVETIITAHGRLDAVINNAGYHLLGAATETTPEELRAQLELNFFGCVNVMQAVVPPMLAQAHGRIINVSSIGAVLATPFASAYNASKFALQGYSESLRAELRPFGVHVSNLIPGFINTGTHEGSVLPTRGQHPQFTPYRARIMDHMTAGGAAGIPMDRVAATVDTILTAAHPRFSYSVDGMASRLGWLKALMPSRVFEGIVSKQTAPGFEEGAQRAASSAQLARVR